MAKLSSTPILICLTGIFLGSLLLEMPNLDRPGITQWDEAFHALVAKNLLKHPLMPTLVESPSLPTPLWNWTEGHIWLHKPILPLWQMALSFSLGGTTTLALRLPSALLNALASCLTFLIGVELFGVATGLIAAALQATSPALVGFVHGYFFSDHINISLLFWTEFAVFFLVRAIRSGTRRDVILVGFGQGLAILSKSFLGLVVLVLALTAWLLPRYAKVSPDRCRLRGKDVLLLSAVTGLTILPWYGYCAIHYPQEFANEQFFQLRHLYSGLAGWEAPWTRVVFDYLVHLYQVFYAPILVAWAFLLAVTYRRRDPGLWIILSWAAGVIIPHLFAVSKTPGATMLAMPALFLGFGYFCETVARGKAAGLTALASILTISLAFPDTLLPSFYKMVSPQGAADLWPQQGPLSIRVVLSRARWLGGLVLGALVLAWAGSWLSGRVSKARRKAVRPWVVGLCTFGLVGLIGQNARHARQITALNFNQPDLIELSRFIRTSLPLRATVLFDSTVEDYPVPVMFYSDRTSYGVAHRELDELRREITARGGIPYLVSTNALPRRALFRGSNRIALYELSSEGAIPLPTMRKVDGVAMPTTRIPFP